MGERGSPTVRLYTDSAPSGNECAFHGIGLLRRVCVPTQQVFRVILPSPFQSVSSRVSGWRDVSSLGWGQVNARKAKEEIFPTQSAALLRSSKPLEYAVGQVLEEIGLTANGPYWYERDGEACETDHLASSFEVQDYFSFRHHIFVECEYRESSKEWVFFPATRNVIDTSEISILDGFVRTKSGRPFTLLGLRHENPLGLPRVGPSTEVFKDQKGGWQYNPQSVDNAIRQAILPVCNHLGAALRQSLLMHDPAVVDLYYPVIVTTAGLYVLKDEVTSKSLDDLADLTKNFRRVPAVVSCFNPPEYAVSFLNERVFSVLSELKPDIETADGKLMLSSYPPQPPMALRPQDVQRLVLEAAPCRVLMISFQSLQATLSAYMDVLRKRILEEFERFRAVRPL
jgi:hypothetical protein